MPETYHGWSYETMGKWDRQREIFDDLQVGIGNGIMHNSKCQGRHNIHQVANIANYLYVKEIEK